MSIFITRRTQHRPYLERYSSCFFLHFQLDQQGCSFQKLITKITLVLAFYNHFLLFRVTKSWSLSQKSTSQRRGTPWTGWPVHHRADTQTQNRQIHARTHIPEGKLSISFTKHANFKTVGGNSIQERLGEKEDMQVWNVTQDQQNLF